MTSNCGYPSDDRQTVATKLSKTQRFATKDEYEVTSGEGPEEELDSGTEPASEGRSRAKRVQGETARVPLPFLGDKERDGKAAPHRFVVWVA